MLIGGPSFAHGAVRDSDGRYRLRQLERSAVKANAIREANGGTFTPGDARRALEATGPIVLEADTLEGLITAMRAGPVRVM